MVLSCRIAHRVAGAHGVGAIATDQVQMRIVEAGNDTSAPKVDHSGVLADKRDDVLVITDGRQSAVSYRDRGGLPQIRVTGTETSIAQDQIGRLRWFSGPDPLDRHGCRPCTSHTITSHA